jgi:hypothetical protein
MKILNYILIFLVGGLFVFSGLIKLNDPMGTEIKLEEYFEVFASDKTELGLSALSGFWHFLAPYSLSIAIMLSVLEVSLGIGLLLGYRRQSTLWSLLWVVVFFGFLTFYSAYFNKVTDCGCFGDAIKLTPWQSFGKDMILLVMVVYLLFQRHSLSSWEGWLPFGISFGITILAFLVAFNAIMHLPMVDFLPYKIGNNIPQQMKPLAELKYGKEQYVYTNLKTGKDEILTTEEFTKNWQKYSDSTQYKFKSYEKPLLNPEALAKITDYRVEDANGADFTQESFKGDKLLIIVPEVKTTYPDAFKKLNELAKTLEKQKITTWILTGEAEKNFENFRHYYQIPISYFLTDKKVLKTMIRANPGIIWLKDGTVKNKWHYNDTPKPEDFK